MFDKIREKLRKLEALFADKAATPGEKVAAGVALEKLLKKLADARLNNEEVTMNFHLQDMWNRKLFVALCRRYNLHPYRKYRQKYTTVVVKAPKSFINEVLWPEYLEMSDVLTEYLEETTSKIIQQEIFENTDEVEVVDDVPTLLTYEPAIKTGVRVLTPEEVVEIDRESLKEKKNNIARNKPCPCGSGKKYKKCCMLLVLN